VTNVLVLGANGELARNERFSGHDVSLNSFSDLIVKLALTPGMESRHSIRVSRG
jgi:hypothetical protein